MIPSPIEDIVLLREHLYLDNIYENMHFILNPLKFTSSGGFKSVKEYGLGYFNNDMRLNDCILKTSNWGQLAYAFCHNFEFFFCIYLIFLCYCLLIIFEMDSKNILDHILHFIKHKKKMLNKSTRILDLQERGEYNKDDHRGEDTSESKKEEKTEEKDFAALSGSNDGGVKLHSRSNNNNLEYNHIKL
ncbi:hypothetical protein QEN19_002930 [Hanseniaspora menglaensis]